MFFEYIKIFWLIIKLENIGIYLEDKVVKIKNIEIIIIIVFLVSYILSNYTSFAMNVNDLRDSTLRIHILANSNSDEDQALKLEVRDAIITVTNDIYKLARSKQEAINIFNNNINRIEKVISETISKSNSMYEFNIELVNMYFTARNYDNIVMPAGEYDAIRVSIGEGKGENWWCVLYPSICVSTAIDKREPVFNDDQQDILENSQKYEVRFAILDVITNIKNILFD